MSPLKLFAEVKLKGVQIINARVTAHIQALNQSGALTPTVKIQLFDNGNGGKSKKKIREKNGNPNS